MEHDLKLNYYKEEIKRNPFFAMVNHSFYKYVTNNKNNFSESKFDFLVAIHSYKGEITNWQTYNYEYGKKLFDEKDFANAAIIFLRLKNCLDMFSVRELLVFIEAFYNSGKYHDANDIIDMLPEDDLEEDMY